jgi:hypothetical protein
METIDTSINTPAATAILNLVFIGILTIQASQPPVALHPKMGAINKTTYGNMIPRLILTPVALKLPGQFRP